MATTKDTKRTEAGRVSYRGESFSGFNKPNMTNLLEADMFYE
jgi:hypothetical protein